MWVALAGKVRGVRIEWVDSLQKGRLVKTVFGSLVVCVSVVVLAAAGCSTSSDTATSEFGATEDESDEREFFPARVINNTDQGMQLTGTNPTAVEDSAGGGKDGDTVEFWDYPNSYIPSGTRDDFESSGAKFSVKYNVAGQDVSATWDESALNEPPGPARVHVTCQAGGGVTCSTDSSFDGGYSVTFTTPNALPS
jgi:hypothetical protein